MTPRRAALVLAAVLGVLLAACNTLDNIPGGVTRGLVAWFDPQDVRAYRLSGANVTQVTNKASGVIWSEATNRPTWNATGLNGFPAFVGDGVASRIISTEAAVISALTPGQPYTVYWVGLAATADAQEAVIGAGNSGVSTLSTRFWGQSTAGSGEWTTETNNDVGGGSDVDTERLVDTVTPHVMLFHGDGSHSTSRIDGIGADPLDGTADAPGTTTLNRVALFCRPDSGPDSFYSGKAGDILIYNVEHTAAERALVVAGLQLKYGLLPAALPTPASSPTNYVDVVIISGQSNAVGLADRPPDFPAGLYHWPHIIGAHTPTALEALGTYDGTHHGIELRLAQLLASKGVTPVIFKVAESSTGLVPKWLPPSAADWLTLASDWSTFLAAVQAQYPGKTIRCHYVWDQGEQEMQLAVNDARVTGYAPDLATNVAGVRALSGTGGTACHAHIIRMHAIDPAASYPSTAAIQAQEDTAAAGITNAHIYNTDAFGVDLAGVNQLHFDYVRSNGVADLVARGILATI